MGTAQIDVKYALSHNVRMETFPSAATRSSGSPSGSPVVAAISATLLMEDPGAADDLPGLAEDGDRDALVVDIEPNVEHG